MVAYNPWFSVMEAEPNVFDHPVRNDSPTLRRKVSWLKGLCTKTIPGYNPQ